MKEIALKLIRLYQLTWSRITLPSCRFTPTCSQYAYEAIQKFGISRGSWLALKRLVRCNPLHPGGFDPVP